MAYITKEQVKEKRAKLKKLLPSSEGWKLSVRRDSGSCICVNILESPIELRIDTSRDYEVLTVNTIKDRPHSALLKEFFDIINEGNYDNSDSMTDYFDVGFYTTIRLGEWDKPYKVVPQFQTS